MKEGIASKLPPIENRLPEKGSLGGFLPSSFPHYNMTGAIVQKKMKDERVNLNASFK